MPRQLPGDNSRFINRTTELDRLNAVLPAEDGDPVTTPVCVVAGTAGAGKTSLVLHWAHQVRDRFPDGQLYVNLRGYDPGQPLSAQEALRGFLSALGAHADSVPQDPEAASAYYRSLLADRTMLIILDNAASVAQVRPLLPGSTRCLTVVTSRSRLSGLAVRDGARRLTLGTLPEPEAVALLRAVTADYRADDDLLEFTELARLCAALPLALRIAGERAASSPHLRLADLIAELRDESVLWDALSIGDAEEAEAVRTVFAWSYRALPEPGATLFRRLGLHPGPEFGLRAAAALAALPVVKTRQLLDSLVGAHLLEQTGPDRYQFHDLLRAYAAELAQQEGPSDEAQAALHRVLSWYLCTAEAARGKLAPAVERTPLPEPPDEAAPPVDFADYDTAMDWAEREHTNLLRTVTAAAGEHDVLAWKLALVLWYVQPPAASMTDWLAVGATGLAAARRVNDSAAEAHLLTCLGLAHHRINQWDESLDCHRQALSIRRANSDRWGEADSLNLIGLIELRRRQLDAAASHFEQAAALWQAAGSERWAASALSNLATTHYNAGRLPEASAYVHEALTAHRAIGNPGGEGNALRILSCLQREQGELEPALRSAEQALDIALALRDQIYEGYWLLALGDAQRELGRLADALASYQRSADLHRRLGNRSREAMSWLGAGETYRALGRPEEAAHFHRRTAAAHHDLADAWNEALALEALAAALTDTDPAAAHRHRSQALQLIAPYEDPRATAVRERLNRQDA
ncbi:ATP-binding protein [Streptomyces sp. NPDC059743]|uniref:ATP-binding protein n=1 Tax=Streptomyces sp. NPDC059743 TaxID=3346928 RepID=UPI0036599A44